MSEKIITVNLSLPLGMGSVNCYLIQNDAGFFLIDTGTSNQRTALESELALAGCKPGGLKLILITHGDFDHTGNAAFLRAKFGAQIAMHPDDSAMTEKGDMFHNRQKGNRVLNRVSSTLFGFGKSKRFLPDIFIDEKTDLLSYGLDARVISIPGHSKGSIAILTVAGDLFCGDLLENIKKPGINSIIDDLAVAQASLARLIAIEPQMVYPGHGQPFSLQRLSFIK